MTLKNRNSQNLAGMKVTSSARGINAHGWSGTGCSIVAPETGVGSYLIEGKGNGGNLLSSPDGIKILHYFGVAGPVITPLPFDIETLNKMYTFSVLAVYSAINVVDSIFDCYGEEIANTVLTVIVIIAVAIIVAAFLKGIGLKPAIAMAIGLMATTAEAKKEGGLSVPNKMFDSNFKKVLIVSQMEGQH